MMGVPASSGHVRNIEWNSSEFMDIFAEFVGL